MYDFFIYIYKYIYNFFINIYIYIYTFKPRKIDKFYEQ